MVLRFAGLIGALVIVGSAHVTQAQVAASDSLAALIDSLSASADSVYVPRYRFTPVFIGKMDANVSTVGMGSEFRSGFTTPWGSIFDFGAKVEKKEYRLNTNFDETKVLRGSDLHTFSPFLFGSATFSDSRVLNRSATVGGGFQDYIINDQLLNLNSTYRRGFTDLMIGSARVDVQGTGGAISSERAFKNDRGLQAGTNGGVAYDIGDRVVWQGRGAVRSSWDESRTTQEIFPDLGSYEDSVITGVRVEAADSIMFDAQYSRYDGDRDFTDQARGSGSAQVGGVENVIQEREERNSRVTTLNMNSRVAPGLFLTLRATHDEQVFDYIVQKTRFSRTVMDGVTGNVRYRFPWRTTSTLQFETSETLRDLGPTSIGTLTDKRKRVQLSLAHRFSRTLQFDFSGSTQLSQSFYLRYDENPRDRDQVDTSLNLRLSSSYFKKLSATVSAVYSNSEYVNIDATQSENNRTRELWELRPGFTYHFNDHLVIMQNYSLSFEYTDYFFKSTENFLDRSLGFSNEFQAKPLKHVRLRFRYDLLLHDAGSYLPDPVTGNETLEVDSEDRRDRTLIRVEYDLKREIQFFAEHQYSRFQDFLPGSNIVLASSTDGQVQVGTNVNYDWGPDRKLRMSLARVKRFSAFGSDAEKEYWDARSEFNYGF